MQASSVRQADDNNANNCDDGILHWYLLPFLRLLQIFISVN